MDWFWKIIGFDPGVLEGLSSTEQALIETLPIIAAIGAIVGLFVAVSGIMRKGRGEEGEEEVETEGLTGLDLEIARIRKLQGKRS